MRGRAGPQGRLASPASDRRPRPRDAPGEVPVGSSAAADRRPPRRVPGAARARAATAPAQTAMSRRGWSRCGLTSRSPQPSPHAHPGDQLLAAGLGVGAAASGLVWASGSSPAWRSVIPGWSWTRLRSPGAGAAAPPPGRPGAGLAGSAQQALPGPAGMYASFVATTAGAAGRPAGSCGCGSAPASATAARRAGQAASRRVSHLGPGSSGRYGSVARARPGDPRPLRGVGGRLLAAEDCHSVLVFGPPGSFKTAGVVIPAILEWTGPVLATSVKPDVIKPPPRPSGAPRRGRRPRPPRQLG